MGLDNLETARKALQQELADLESRAKAVRQLLATLNNMWGKIPAVSSPPATPVPDKPQAQPRIEWASAVDRVFENHDGLKLADVRRLIADEEGIKEALDDRYRPSISAALGRRVRDLKTLRREDDGTYFKITEDAQAGDTFGMKETNWDEPNQ